MLEDIGNLCKKRGVEVKYVANFHHRSKGDLDGEKIYIDTTLSTEEKLFNILHLFGHTVQRNISDTLRALGSKLYNNPSEDLLDILMKYEYESNCFGAGLLKEIGKWEEMKEWMQQKYVIDAHLLKNFYKSGKKQSTSEVVFEEVRENFTDIIPLEVPQFTVNKHFEPRFLKGGDNTGLVINFE